MPRVDWRLGQFTPKDKVDPFAGALDPIERALLRAGKRKQDLADREADFAQQKAMRQMAIDSSEALSKERNELRGDAVRQQTANTAKSLIMEGNRLASLGNPEDVANGRRLLETGERMLGSLANQQTHSSFNLTDAPTPGSMAPLPSLPKLDAPDAPAVPPTTGGAAPALGAPIPGRDSLLDASADSRVDAGVDTTRQTLGSGIRQGFEAQYSGDKEVAQIVGAATGAYEVGAYGADTKKMMDDIINGIEKIQAQRSATKRTRIGSGGSGKKDDYLRRLGMFTSDQKSHWGALNGKALKADKENAQKLRAAVLRVKDGSKVSVGEVLGTLVKIGQGNSRITDKDVDVFARSNSAFGTLFEWFTKNAQGTLSQERANEILAMLDSVDSGLDDATQRFNTGMKSRGRAMGKALDLPTDTTDSLINELPGGKASIADMFEQFQKSRSR